MNGLWRLGASPDAGRDADEGGKVTDEYIIDAVRRYHRTLDNPGLCLACGHECEGVVSDAREHTCEVCGEPRVFGA